jgi:hypothetical protein
MEAAGLRVFEELLHLLPALQTLNLIFIGPAFKMSPSESSHGKGDVKLCRTCLLEHERVWGVIRWPLS